MVKCNLKAIAVAISLSVAPTMLQATELVIYHNWSTASEVAALNVLRKELEAKGHTWKDLAIPHDTGSNVSLLNLVTAGDPPNVFLESSLGFYRDLKRLKLDRPLTDYYKEQGYLEHFPSAVVDSITVDGEMMKIPTGIHIDGMMYYNKDVAKAVGVEPEKWDSLEAMWADFDKIKKAGVLPLAIGGQKWQVGYLTHALAAAINGKDFYNKIYSSNPDPEVLDSTEMRTLLSWLRKFQQAADKGSVNRDWNVTTNMVITGKALLQVHGDWMKGEWQAANKEANKDFGCVPIAGAKTLVVSVDAWGLLGGQSKEKDQAELDFASIVVDPEVQGRFAKAKGSTPVRLDVPESSLDACSKGVLKVLADKDKQVQNPYSMVDVDWQNSLWDVLFNFWSNPEMTEEEAIKAIKNNYDMILG